MIDAIVCAKDVDPNFGFGLECLERQRDLGKIIVVIPEKDRRTYETACCYRTVPIREPTVSCLAWARKQGALAASNKFICFVDADVLLGKDHLIQLRRKAERWLEFTSHVAIEGILNILYTKNTLTNVPVKYLPEFLRLNKRGFLHNTLLKRESVLSWKPQYAFAWEDYLLTRHIQSLGGFWIRVQQEAKSLHLSDGNKYAAAKWSGAGERVVRGWSWDKGNALARVLQKDGRYYYAKVVSLAGQVIGNLQASKHLEKIGAK